MENESLSCRDDMRFAWHDMMQASARMGIMPSSFWQLSIKEWCALMASPKPQSIAMSRREFEILTSKFADQNTKENNDKQ
jgi:hypothetical protein